MAISAQPDFDALSGLAQRVAAAVRGPEAEALADDPFTLALKRYQSEGAPAHLGGRWRDALIRPVDPSSGPALLRKLDRDLLSGVMRYATGAMQLEPEAIAGEPSEPSPRTLKLATDAETLPALVMGSDGTWHADDARAASTTTHGGRLARLAGFASRYPDRGEVTARRQPLLERIGPAAAAAALTARVTPTPAPPAFFPPTGAELRAFSAEARPVVDDELLRTVSGGVELVVGPFTRLQQLAAFTRALREMQGVEDVSARQFTKGLVHIRVHYADEIPLTNRLAQLREFSPTVVSATKSRIELKVEPPDSAPATS